MIAVDPAIVAWCTVALLLGGLIKGTLGVGTPLLTVPLMALVLPAHQAVVLMAAPVLFANLWQMVHAGGAAAVLRRFWPVALCIFAGALAGAKALSVLDAGPLLITVGTLAVLFAILLYTQSGLRLAPALERPVGIATGLASGVVGGLSSMFGPPLIAYLSALHLGRDLFVSVVGFLYLSALVPWVVSLFAFGVLDLRTAAWSLLATLPVALGVYLGQRLRRHIPEHRFRRVVLVVLLASGLMMLWRGLTH